MAIFGISCSCFLVLLQLFVLNVKTETASATVESLIQVTDGETGDMETKTREPRHVKREMPYLLIRPSHVSGKTVFFIENPPPYKMKNADPRSFTSMVGNPEFYIKEGEIFSLEKMYPFFGIDPSQGFMTNVKKGNMQHFLSGRPSSTKHYLKPIPSKNVPIYHQAPPRQTSPRPFREELPQASHITPATYRDAYPNKPHSAKQEIVYHQALTEELTEEQPRDTFIHNAEYSPVYTHKDVIMGKAVDTIMPPPKFRHHNPHFSYRPNALQQTYYHPLHAKTIDLTERRPSLSYQENNIGPYFNNIGPYSGPTKSPLTIFRKAPQIEYFMPQNQNYAEIKIHTDMDKSVQVQSHDNPFEESAQSVKYHSTVKLNKERPVEPYFDINKHYPRKESRSKNSVDMTTEIPFLLYDDGDNIEPQKFTGQPKLETKNKQVELRPVSEASKDDVLPTYPTLTVTEPTKVPSYLNKPYKQRKHSSKFKSTPAPTTTTESLPPLVESLKLDRVGPVTPPPDSCEKECIKNLPSKGFDPVCGSDNITYTNKGKLRCAQTCKRNDLTIKSFGVCGKTS